MDLESGHIPSQEWAFSSQEIKPGGFFFEWESVKKKVRDSAAKGDWETVERSVDMDDDGFFTMPITTSNDTILHLAALNGQTDFILIKLKKILDETLLYTNESGNTPLHLAASVGHTEICKGFLQRAPELANHRNISGETPVFLAALNNCKETFLFLREKSLPESLRRNSDGETVLHSSILAEEFEFACMIVKRCSDLVYSRNERGYTPLHLLANNSSSFKSGYEMGKFYEAICSWINPKVVESRGQSELSTKSNINESNEETHKISIVHQEINPSVDESRRQSQETNVSAKSNINESNEETSKVSFVHQEINPSVDESRRQSQETNVSAKSNINESNEETSKVSFVHQVVGEVRKRLTLVYLLPCIWCMMLLELLVQAILPIEDMRKKQQKHSSAMVVMEEMLRCIQDWSGFGHYGSGMNPNGSSMMSIRIDKNPDEIEIHPSQASNLELRNQSSSYSSQKAASNIDSNGSSSMKEANRDVIITSPLLIAVKKGVIEFVNAILQRFPQAVHDMDSENKNILLLAAEYGQLKIYDRVRKSSETLLGKVDREGNTVLHLAAKLQKKQPLLDSNAAILMQEEIKWFKYVEGTTPQRFTKQQNHKGETAMEIFMETHRDLAMQRAKWLSSTSKSGSVVATLIITVAFATASSVPGGLKDSGTPVLQGKPGFDAFTISSIAALCFSSTSTIIFLSILTSPYKELDFENVMPRKLIYGILSLFISIVAMYSSFFSGYRFVIDRKLQYVVFPVFMGTLCLALTNFRLYYEFIKSTIGRMVIPKRRYQ